MRRGTGEGRQRPDGEATREGYKTRILVCLDTTEFAQSILPVALYLANASHADIELLAVVPQETPSGEARSGAPESPSNENALAVTRASLSKVATTFSVTPQVTVVAGRSAADGIIKHARLTRPDVIAMATHSRGALGEAALGSTARDVTRSGVAPVLLSHPLGATGIRTGEIPVGIHVFTSDGELLGTVAEASADEIRIHADAGPEFWLPAGVTGAITIGRLVLEVRASEIPRLAAAHNP